MIRAPECIDGLEARIASNIEHVIWRKGYGGKRCHKVSSKSFACPGYGDTAESAVLDFLKQNHFAD
jgi:hypothetical protein